MTTETMTDLITAEEAEKLLDGPLLTGLVNEHRALLLQAIGTDDADAMAYSKDGKPIRRVREITSPAKQAAEVIGNLARTVIALHAQLADAPAAQAMVGEKALNLLDYHVTNDDDRMTMRQAIRALAPIDGLALVRELRDRAEKAETLRDEAVEKYAAGVDKRLADQTRAESAEAERDRLATANAVLEAKVAGLRDLLERGAMHVSLSLRAWHGEVRAALATQEAGNA